MDSLGQSSTAAVGAANAEAPHPQGALYARAEALLEWPMLALALLFVLAIAAEEMPSLPTPLRQAASIVDWVVWCCFACEYFLLFGLSRRRGLYLRTHWLEALMVVLPALRLLRFLRVFRALRAVRAIRATSSVVTATRSWREAGSLARRRGLGVVVVAVLSTLLVGAQLMYLVERGVNEQFSSYGTSLWWALVTATTVGYGDAAPQTALGRVFASVFMLVGIAAFGIVSAAVAAHFVKQEDKASDAEIHRRLDKIEETLCRLETRLPEPADRV